MDHIDELPRGVARRYYFREGNLKALESGKKLNIYLGIDTTSTQIHLGHAVPAETTSKKKVADLGLSHIFLIGDFTALIGDTSDKDSERPVSHQ